MKTLVPGTDSAFAFQVPVDSSWIGPRLRQIRIAAGYDTQAALGAKIGVRQGVVGKWEAERSDEDDSDESGLKGQEPKYSAIMLLSKALGVLPAEFSKPAGSQIRWASGKPPKSKKGGGD